MLIEKLKCDKCGALLEYDELKRSKGVNEDEHYEYDIHRCPHCGSEEVYQCEVLVCPFCEEEKSYTDMAYRTGDICDDCMEILENRAIDVLRDAFDDKEMAVLADWFGFDVNKKTGGSRK